METSTNCLADASCYELSGGGSWTGGCPAGQVLELEPQPLCIEDPMPCPEGFELVDGESDCLQDVACFDVGSGFCTGACPEGAELHIDETGASCVPATPSCIEGFEVVESESDCLADAICYAELDKFCTGECPEATEFGQSETGPACLPVP